MGSAAGPELAHRDHAGAGVGEHERGRLTHLLPARSMTCEPRVRRARVNGTSAEHPADLPGQALTTPGHAGQQLTQRLIRCVSRHRLSP